MCGRTACTLEPEVLCKACSYKKGSTSDKYVKPEWIESSDGKQYQPSTNFSPTFYGPVLISKRLVDPSASPDERVIQPMLWGMIPPWHKGTPTKHGLTTNNCRIESITEKKLYSVPLAKGNRCVILCDGFYEWKAMKDKGAKKQPYFIYAPQPEGISIAEPETWENLPEEALWSPDGGWKGPRPIMLAGIFDTWRSHEDGSLVQSYSVVTMDASPAFAFIHERMPAVLETEEDVNNWLDSAHVPAEKAISKLKASTNLPFHPVSPDVGSVKNQERSLTRPIDLDKPKPLSGSGKLMASWLSKKSSSVPSRDTTNNDSPKSVSAQVERAKHKLPSSSVHPDEPPTKLKKEDQD